MSFLRALTILLLGAQASMAATITAGDYPTGLVVNAPGEQVTQTGDITVAGTTTIRAQDVSLTASGNDFDQVDIKATGFVDLVDTSQLQGAITAGDDVSLVLGVSAGQFVGLSTLVSGGNARITSGLVSTVTLALPTAFDWRISGDLTFITNTGVEVLLNGAVGGIELIRRFGDIGGDITVRDFGGQVLAFDPMPVAAVPLPAAFWMLFAGFAMIPVLARFGR